VISAQNKCCCNAGRGRPANNTTRRGGRDLTGGEGWWNGRRAHAARLTKGGTGCEDSTTRTFHGWRRRCAEFDTGRACKVVKRRGEGSNRSRRTMGSRSHEKSRFAPPPLPESAVLPSPPPCLMCCRPPRRRHLLSEGSRSTAHGCGSRALGAGARHAGPLFPWLCSH